MEAEEHQLSKSCLRSKLTLEFTSFQDGFESLWHWTNPASKTWLIFMSRLCVSDLETTDGHLFLPDWVSVSDQSLFSLPLLHSAGDRCDGRPRWLTYTQQLFPVTVLNSAVVWLFRQFWWQTCRLRLHAPLQLDLHCRILWLHHRKPTPPSL